MNKTDAKRIAQEITNEQLLQMFKNAKEGIKDWKEVSIINKIMSKGAAWNILAKNFDVNKTWHERAKFNMIREFGEFLPENIKPTKAKPKANHTQATHQEPDFSNYETGQMPTVHKTKMEL